MRTTFAFWVLASLIVLIWETGWPGTFSKPVIWTCMVIYGIHWMKVLYEYHCDRYRTDSESILVRQGGPEQDSVGLSSDLMVERRREARDQLRD